MRIFNPIHPNAMSGNGLLGLEKRIPSSHAVIIVVSIFSLSLLSMHMFFAATAKQPQTIFAEDYIKPSETSTSKITSSIQEAIDASSKTGKLLFFRESDRTYIIESTVRIPSNANVDFNNCVIKRDGTKSAFDMIINSDKENGNTNITIKNLKIDGNKMDLTPVTPASRFAGIRFINVKNSELDNVEVSYTVNGEQQPEGNRAGVMFENCSDITARNLNGHNNDRTAIMLIDSKVKILGSLTYDNKGSGISSNNADYSEYYDITTHDNGYSQLSVNGEFSRVFNVNAHNGAKGYSNVNIGHNNVRAASHGTVVKNVISGSSKGWGVTISGSDNVELSKIDVSESSDYGIYIMDGSNHSDLSGIGIKNSMKSGIYYKHGKGHRLDKADIHDNGTHGISIEKNVDITIGVGVRSFNNGKEKSSGSAGVAVSGSADILGGEYFDDGSSPTQETGIWVAGGDANINNARFFGNKSTNIKNTGSARITGNSK